MLLSDAEREEQLQGMAEDEKEVPARPRWTVLDVQWRRGGDQASRDCPLFACVERCSIPEFVPVHLFTGPPF
jgi:hypothetical protein